VSYRFLLIESNEDYQKDVIKLQLFEKLIGFDEHDLARLFVEFLWAVVKQNETWTELIFTSSRYMRSISQ